MQRVGWHKIIELRVQGGFLDGQVIPFSPYLNCLIGGRGAGKTSIIELIRFALDACPGDQPLSKKSRQHVAAILGTGRVKLVVETSGGQRYTVQRSVGEDPRITDPQGQRVSMNMSRGLTFGVILFGQSELEEIAERPATQLELVDGKSSTIPFIKAEIETGREKLEHNRTELAKAIRQAQDFGGRLSILPEIRQRLQTLAGENLDELLSRQRQREKERFWLEEMIRALRSVCQREKRLSVPPVPSIDCETDIWSNGELIQEVAEIYESAGRQVCQLWYQSAGIWETAVKELEDRAASLARRHHREELEDERSQGQLKGQGINHALQERARLTSQLLELEKLVGMLARQEEEIVEYRQQRADLHNGLARLKEKLFRERWEICQEFNRMLYPDIKINLLPGGNLEVYRELLATALSNSGLQYNRLVEQLVEEVPPRELVRIIQDRDAMYLEHCSGLDRDRARRLVNHLSARLNPGELLFLEDVWLEDQLQINLRDGELFKPIDQLSKGQKSTAILPLLLLDDCRPLIIDQPEDHLDNAYVSSTVVPTLRRVKGQRQIILATHNPNIPVLGNADQNLVLYADGRCSRVACQGDLNDVRVNREIQRFLEGGSEALRGRVERYV